MARLHEKYHLPVEQEVACHEILIGRGGEVIVHGDVLMAGQDGFQQRFLLQIGYELARGGVLLLHQIVASCFGRIAAKRAAGAFFAPETVGGAPDVLGEEGHMHAEHHGQAALRLGLEQGHLAFGDIAIDIVEGDEVHPMRHLALKLYMEGIVVLYEGPRVVLVGLAVLLLGVAEPHVGGELVVAHRAHGGRAQILAYEVEVRFALPVDEVARMDDVIGVLACPVERVAQCFLLPAAEGVGSLLMKALLLVVLMPVGGREVRVGDMQHGERLLEPYVYGAVRERQTLVSSTFGKPRGVVRGPGGQR